MKTKSLLMGVKVAPEEQAGTFTGYASVFGNVDSYGDKVVPGAFTESLKSFGESGSGIPCYWSHQMSDPMMCIGWTKSAVEDEHGLKVDVQLDLDNPNGAQAYKLIKAGVVGQMSFAFEIEDYADVKTEEDGSHTELRKLKIFEVSLVQVGANQATELLDVKSRLSDFQESQELPSGIKERLVKAQEMLDSVLNDEGLGKEPEPSDNIVTDEEPSEGNGEDPQSVDKPEDPTQAKSNTLKLADEVELLMIKLSLKEI